MLNIIVLNIIMLDVIILNFIMLNVVILSVTLLFCCYVRVSKICQAELEGGPKTLPKSSKEFITTPIVL
jgi:hypothetical protein